MLDVQLLHQLLRTAHILAGTFGLILFWIPILSPKGGRIHAVSGWAFVWTARFVIVTALTSITWALTAPIHFSGIDRALTSDELYRISRDIRFLFGILGLLTTWFLLGITTALGAVRFGRRPTHGIGRSVRPILIAACLANLLALGWGICAVAATAESRFWIFAVLGGFGLADGWSTHKKIACVERRDMPWQRLHIENMLGAGVAFYTAFFVFGARQLIGDLPGPMALLPWILPAAIGVPASHFTVRRYVNGLAPTPQERSHDF